MIRRPCKYCGAPLGFVQDRDGKMQVLDLRSPVYEATQNLEGNGLEGAQEVVRHRGAFVSHFVTCPKRDEARADAEKRKVSP